MSKEGKGIRDEKIMLCCSCADWSRRVRTELGCRTCLGVSNISFGLPARAFLNATFYTMALEAGLSAGIVNPLSVEMMTAYRAFRALTARDAQCTGWIAHAPMLQTASAPAQAASRPAGNAAGTAADGYGGMIPGNRFTSPLPRRRPGYPGKHLPPRHGQSGPY